MTKNTLAFIPVLFAATIFSLTSCGGNSGKENSDSTKKDSAAVKVDKQKSEGDCKGQNKISLNVKGYKFAIDGKLVIDMADFEVKQSSWKMIGPSLAEMTLKNYSAEEAKSSLQDGQFEIHMDFHAPNGKKIVAGTYGETSGKDLWTQTHIDTNKGQVWFNHTDEMPAIGTVQLNYADAQTACGVITLASEKPDDGQIGVVKLNGDFVAGK
jgi:hypothetical protein